MPGRILMVAVALLLGGCDGPHEEAGERADVRNGLVDSVGSIKAGPMERAGERLDELEERKEQ
jgi:hypothetical protein